MWRYLAGGVAALLMVAAGWMVFSGRARSDPVLPPAPQAVAAGEVAVDDAPVPEASEKTREEKRFDRYDKDRNGKIAREEYLASRRKAFAKLDANGDGRLSFEEWGAKTLAKFAGADGDKSGAMDRTEFATTAVKRSARPKCVCPVVADGDN
ncbi:EF-hand domain-containing protein [Sphingomonas radiodurans]|uniref:EF-hand domain-containing protein n=1 Tax=Sphingomonas radiodurans TaxID=2890321 RepID=UPI001E32A532|nr:EF-hand domain-containing protein [Sphingomonas radiodurans]WBH16023.1 EF-hand domain-containing protein [Sphingomonas radiodurans]